MIKTFLDLPELYFFNATFGKPALKKIVQSYSFLYFSINALPNQDQKQSINQNIKESKVIIFDQIKYSNEETNENYFLIGFEKTLIIFDQISSLEYFLSSDSFCMSDLSFCFLSDTKSIIEERIEIKNNQIETDLIFLDEIQSFNNDLQIFKVKGSLIHIWSFIT